MGPRVRLVLLSFLVLFLELALIRWTGGHIFYLSYFSNFVLLGSFLGIGVGFLRARSRLNLFAWAPLALVALVVFVRLFPVEIGRPDNQVLYFGNPRRTGLPMWATLPIVFLAVAFVMAMVAEGAARVFVTFKPLEAYRLDLVGSISGIVAFSILSFLGIPPLGWAAVVAVVFALVYVPSITLKQWGAIAVFLVILGTESFTPRQSWSPYYRVSLVPVDAELTIINVNGVPHQGIEPVEGRLSRSPIYGLPYDRAASNPLRDVLVVGAGNGGDVAVALAKGARHVDAVEIDPRLFELGKELNPDHPYDDPRVSVFIDDGRAFLERTHHRYDLILFALPDSITLVAGQSSLRLESYLFTEEAIGKARDHLQPKGAFALYNFYRQQWLVDRLAGTLDVVFGHPPCLDTVGAAGHLAMLTTSVDPAAVSCPTSWRLDGRPLPSPATDDHPFVYLKRAGIPGFYLMTLFLILAASVLFVRFSSGPLGRLTGYLDLFFMGAAFLLLETKNVVQFALLFGTTWLVNALVFTGILLSVLAAVEVARHIRFRRQARLYGVLLAALAVAWAVPAHSLLSLPVVLRFLAATTVAFAPVFIANLVFAERFRDAGSSAVAFGANLLGAMVGGLLEYTSLMIGYRALLLVTAALYGVAFLLGRRSLLPAPAGARSLAAARGG